MNRILELVQSGDFDPTKEFTGNKDKFLEVKAAFENISNNLPKEVCINFILTKIIPSIFDKNVANNVRDEAVEIGLHVLQFVNITILGTKEQGDVFHSIEEPYVKIIGELRDSGYSNWHRLWIFLIKLCSDTLHSKMSLANKLLRVVEVAFRNSTSIEQRLRAYDCWMELINNSSLNMQHMCSAKQIKLLMTPMRAKFSRMPVVIMKRCDTFVYLLDKLGDKATLCLREFLEFCFGPFDDKNDVEKMKQGRSVPEVCNKSTLVLLEIIGHSHSSAESCLISNDLRIYKSLITSVNFPNFAEILINSVVQCCVLLNEWSQDAPKNSTIIKCLWRSVLQFIQNSNDDVKKRCYIQINNCLQKLSESTGYNDYLCTVLVNIIDLLIHDEMTEKLKETVFDVSIKLLHHFTDSCSFSLENIQNFVISCFDPENGSKFDRIASNSFKNAKCENMMLSQVWLKCKIAIVPDNISNYIWPVHCQNFKDADALKAKWTKLYATECKSDSVKVVIMQELEKLFLENPLLSSNVVQFLELISSGEVNPGRDFVAKFMRLVELVLTLPNLSDDDVNKISFIVLTYCTQNQHFYKYDNIDEALNKLCSCLEHLITIHKDYTILMKLFECLRDAQPKILAKFSKRLMTFLEALMLNEDNSIANNTRQLIELLETKASEQETVSFASSRSLRIINMANNTTKSKRLSTEPNNVKPSAAVKSTKTFTTPKGKNIIVDTKRKKDPISINEDNSADYVKVDTEVKIDVNNLNEHQKEMFNKRREDIPALYQELTQSQSQDFFKRIEKIDNKESDEKRKDDDLPKENDHRKKRRRSDDEDEEHPTKTRKTSPKSKLVDAVDVNSEELGLNDVKTEILDNNDLVEDNREKIFEPDDSMTQVPDSIDPNFRKILDDVELEPIQKVPPEELFQDPLPEIKTETIPNKAPENTDEESVNNTNTSIEITQTQVNELVQSNVDEKESNKCDDVSDDVPEKNIRVSPRSPKKKRTPNHSPEKGLRKSKRNTIRKIREELVNAVKKQLEQLNEQDTDDETVAPAPEINENKVATEAQKSENDVLDNGEVENETKEGNQEDKQENMKETSLRKSKRQIKKRHSDYVTLLKKKTKDNANHVKENQKPVSQSSEDFFETQPEQKSVNKEDNAIQKNKKKQKRQSLPVQSTKNNVENESIGELLERVDKRIEENKKSDKTKSVSSDFPDDNDNEIVQVSEDTTEVTTTEEDIKIKKNKKDLFSAKKEKKRYSLPVTITSANVANVDIPSVSINVAVDNATQLEKSAVDVYEFKAEEESVASDEAKKKKKRRKGLAFNRSDYISKRRKKPKKDAREEGFPFHVTADSPVPLSQSPSLRAVPSSQTSETITIVITRSPPDSSKENQESQSDSSVTNTPASPKKKNKRKQSPNSEDLIESSQSTPVLDLVKRKSKSRSLKQTTLEETLKLLDSPESHKRKTRSSQQKDAETAETETMSLAETETISLAETETISLAETETISLDVVSETDKKISSLKIPKTRRFSLTEPSSQKVDIGKRAKRSKSLERLDFTPEAITFSFEKFAKDERVHVNDSSADTLTCDTILTNEVSSQDTRNVHEADTLSLSPVRSPPKQDLPGSPITCDTPERTNELLNNTSDISPISSTSEVTTPVPKQTNEVSNRRVARLLQMVNSNVQVSNEGRRWFGNKFASPTSGRMRKMRMKKEENLDILTFSREVPSPLTVPASGILKRKFGSLDETATPSPKRKRVNFSDPAITDKKLFIKDSEEYEIDQNTCSTNESQVDNADDLSEKVNNKETKGILGAFERDDALLSFKDFCDYNFKDTSLDSSEVRKALNRLLPKLKVPEVAEMLVEYLTGTDVETVAAIKNTLTDAGSSEQIVDQIIVPLIDNVVHFEDFLPKLLKVVEKLPNEQLQHFIEEVNAAFGDKRPNAVVSATERIEQVENHIFSRDCDEMHALIKKYFSNLENQQRNDFLVDLMTLASNELPVNKEFVNSHVTLLQNFVKRMSD